MPIPASQIVQINPRLLTPGGVDLEFNGLFLTDDDSIPTSQIVLPFASPEAVAAYFGDASNEAKAATKYFLGYANSFKKPRVIYFGRLISDAAAGWIRGGALEGTTAASLAVLKSITAGTLTLTIGGAECALTGLDFSTATALSGVATTLQTAIRAKSGAALTAATVEYNSAFDAFIITAGNTGATSTMGYATGTAATALGLTQAAGAVLSDGSAALTLDANMQKFLDVTRNWVTFTTVEPVADGVDYAAWASEQGVDFLYVDHKATQAAATTQAGIFTTENVGATAGVLGSVEYAAMLMGAAASIDFDRRQGTITFAFKRQEGLPANVFEGQTAQALEAIRWNFVGDYATRNDNFVFLYPGAMFGDWMWLDPYANAVWLKNALQVSIMAGLTQCPRVPYNDAGYTLIRSWCQDPINRALHSGIIDVGVTLSESQKAEVAREAGRDISAELYTDGYYLQVLDPSPAVRQRRESPEVSLWYAYGSSVHRISLASTALV